jgi:hypothetical protein
MAPLVFLTSRQRNVPRSKRHLSQKGSATDSFVTHVVDRRKGELQRERRDARREVLLFLLVVELILMGRARILGDELIHDVL